MKFQNKKINIKHNTKKGRKTMKNKVKLYLEEGSNEVIEHAYGLKYKIYNVAGFTYFTKSKTLRITFNDYDEVTLTNIYKVMY